jgi:ketosteroid isomerase-like protein
MTDDRRRLDLEAIERLHARDAAASKAQDFETLRTLLDPNAVVIPPKSLAVSALAQLEARIARVKAEPVQVEILDYRFIWDEIELVGDYAFERGRIVGVARPAPDAGPAPMAFNVMRILKRQPDGDWKVYRSIWNEAPLMM